MNFGLPVYRKPLMKWLFLPVRKGGHGFRLEALINRFAPEETSVEGRKVYRCPVCGYEYVGDLESEPDDYVCPLCGQPKKAFVLKK